MPTGSTTRSMPHSPRPARSYAGLEPEPKCVPAATEKAPHLVVLDMQIGNMGGMAACMALHLEESGGRLPHLPVLMLLDRPGRRLPRATVGGRRLAAQAARCIPSAPGRASPPAGRNVPRGPGRQAGARPAGALRRRRCSEQTDSTPRRSGSLGAPTTGVWLSLVERCVRDAEVVGSNPATPTSRAAGQTLFGPLSPGDRAGDIPRRCCACSDSRR